MSTSTTTTAPQESVISRRFSLEQDFMYSRCDTQLYALLRCFSTAKPSSNPKQLYEEYLPKATYLKNKKFFSDIRGISPQTLKNRLNKLIESGLVKEGTYLSNNTPTPCYYFPYDYDGLYKLINKDLLRYLAVTTNPLTLRVYLYLLNKSGMKEDYQFSLSEIAVNLGYSSTTKEILAGIKEILILLKQNKLISYSSTHITVYGDNGSTYPKPILILHWATSSLPDFLRQELKQFPAEA